MEAGEGAVGGGVSGSWAGAGQWNASRAAGATWHDDRCSLVGRRARTAPGKNGQGDGGAGKAGQGDGGGLGLERGIVPTREFFYLIPVVLRVDFSKP